MEVNSGAMTNSSSIYGQIIHVWKDFGMAKKTSSRSLGKSNEAVGRYAHEAYV